MAIHRRREVCWNGIWVRIPRRYVIDSSHSFLSYSLIRDLCLPGASVLDAGTKDFLAQSLDPVFGFPQFVRFSWSTASNILDDKAVSVDWSVPASPLCFHGTFYALSLSFSLFTNYWSLLQGRWWWWSEAEWCEKCSCHQLLFQFILKCNTVSCY